MSTRVLPRLIAALLGSALVLSACGGASSVDASRNGNESSAAPADDIAENESDDAESEGGDDADGVVGEVQYRSPISEFLGAGPASFEDSEDEIVRMQNEVEVLTAECMQRLGWEYVPRDTSDFMFFGDPSGLDPDSDEWVTTYGFGITTMRFPQSMVGPDLVGMDDEMMGGPFGDGEEPFDPNQEYVESLSDTAREAYYEDLHGIGPSFDPSTMSEEEMEAEMRDFVPTGCSSEAHDEVFGGSIFGGPDREFYDEFGDQLENLYERIESDPRIVSAQSELSACVADRGLDWSGDMQDLYERFEDRLNSIGGQMHDPFAGTGLDPSEMSQEELDEFFENLPPPTLSAEDKALLAELQAEELELAKAVNECGGGQRAMNELYNEVRIEYEEAFVADNAEALEPFRSDD